jgi:hypothetical protein
MISGTFKFQSLACDGARWMTANRAICHHPPIEIAKAIITHSFRVTVFPPEAVPFRLGVGVYGRSDTEANCGSASTDDRKPLGVCRLIAGTWPGLKVL